VQHLTCYYRSSNWKLHWHCSNSSTSVLSPVADAVTLKASNTSLTSSWWQGVH